MVEKLLTNWMSICLYTFVRVREAEVDEAPFRESGCQPRSLLYLPSLCTPAQHVLSHLKPSASCPLPQSLHLMLVTYLESTNCLSLPRTQ